MLQGCTGVQHGLNNYLPRARAQNRAAKGLAKLRPSIAEAAGERRGVAPGSFVDLLVHATDKATGLSLTDLERTNQARSLASPRAGCLLSPCTTEACAAARVLWPARPLYHAAV
jgi:hypothetical protein